ncbi:MAG: hypothetical protein LBC84_01100 [Prevotellaceae bacterium]|jgi:hypothetical protein|nr:hypothetical protein [Prevotellaceae bacterium]
MTRRIDRFDEYLTAQNMSDRVASHVANLFDGVFTRARKENKDLTDRTIKKLLYTFTDINPDWLLHGIGNMERYKQPPTTNFEDVLLKKLDNIERLLEQILKTQLSIP